MSSLRRALPALVLAAALAALLGCDKETTKPQPAIPLAQLETIWPNEDGRGWVFAIKAEKWKDTTTSIGYFPTPRSVPPAPSVSSLMNFFTTYPKGDSVTADSGRYTFQFNGEITTLSGVTAQNAMETMGPPVARLETLADRLGPDPVLRWLRQMRPDLSLRASSARAPNSTSRPRRRCFYMGTRGGSGLTASSATEISTRCRRGNTSIPTS